MKTIRTKITENQTAKNHFVGRPTKHPWLKIEALYVCGEDVEKPAKEGQTEPAHNWPSQIELSKRFNIRREQVSKRFARVGVDGRTINQLREAFQVNYRRQLDDTILRALVGREIGFRVANMELAELGLRHVARLLARAQSGDSLLKLLTAAKRSQEIGLIALDRPANGPEGGISQGTEDWSLMRDIRSGSRPVPELCGMKTGATS